MVLPDDAAEREQAVEMSETPESSEQSARETLLRTMANQGGENLMGAVSTALDSPDSFGDGEEPPPFSDAPSEVLLYRYNVHIKTGALRFRERGRAQLFCRIVGDKGDSGPVWLQEAKPAQRTSTGVRTTAHLGNLKQVVVGHNNAEGLHVHIQSVAVYDQSTGFFNVFEGGFWLNTATPGGQDVSLGRFVAEGHNPTLPVVDPRNMALMPQHQVSIVSCREIAQPGPPNRSAVMVTNLRCQTVGELGQALAKYSHWLAEGRAYCVRMTLNRHCTAADLYIAVETVTVVITKKRQHAAESLGWFLLRLVARVRLRRWINAVTVLSAASKWRYHHPRWLAFLRIFAMSQARNIRSRYVDQHSATVELQAYLRRGRYRRLCLVWLRAVRRQQMLHHPVEVPDGTEALEWTLGQEQQPIQDTASSSGTYSVPLSPQPPATRPRTKAESRRRQVFRAYGGKETPKHKWARWGLQRPQWMSWWIPDRPKTLHSVIGQRVPVEPDAHRSSSFQMSPRSSSLVIWEGHTLDESPPARLSVSRPCPVTEGLGGEVGFQKARRSIQTADSPRRSSGPRSGRQLRSASDEQNLAEIPIDLEATTFIGRRGSQTPGVRRQFDSLLGEFHRISGPTSVSDAAVLRARLSALRLMCV